jgi:hypothetical protein
MIQIPLTPEQFDSKVVQLAAQQGINMIGHEGTIEKMGVKANYLYENGVLSITILDKPFLLSEEMVESQLKAWL